MDMAKSFSKFANYLEFLDAFFLIMFKAQDGTPRGVGNQVSAEFAIAYRWHSCISEKDDKWTQNLYRELFGKDAEDVSLGELLQGLGKWEHSLDKDPQKRPFAKLQRDANGKFSDDDLVRILTESVEDVAGNYFGPLWLTLRRGLTGIRLFRRKQYPQVSQSSHYPWNAAGQEMGPWLPE